MDLCRSETKQSCCHYIQSTYGDAVGCSKKSYVFSVVSSPGANIINTNCSAAHTRQALCCKMSVEYDKFIESQRK